MRLPLLSGKDVLNVFQRLGFHEISRRGSHVKMEHGEGRRIVFPFHKEVDRFTLRGSLRDADVSEEECLVKVESCPREKYRRSNCLDSERKICSYEVGS